MNIIHNNRSPKLKLKKEVAKPKTNSNRLSDAFMNKNKNKNPCLTSFTLNKKSK